MYFEDEAPIEEGRLPRLGRVRRGDTLYGRQPYITKKYTMLAVISNKSVVKVWLSQIPACDSVVKQFMLPISGVQRWLIF